MSLSGTYWEGKADLLKRGLDEDLRDEIITYGELVQAAYDNLGLHPHTEQYGNATKTPEQFLDYLHDNYRLLVPPEQQPGVRGNPGGVSRSTFDRYKLPAAEGLSPLIRGLPGKAAGEDPDATRHKGVKLFKPLANDTAWTLLCKVAPGLLVNKVGGDRPLFEKEDKPRGTFFGYVALSEPQNPPVGSCEGRDVALVWRGTQFKEEWESNFCENQLDVWDAEQYNYKIVPKADEVGVHAGFMDLYTRPVPQPGLSNGEGPPPRQVVHEWLMHLMKHNNITTITTTGHSLGGGLATICAYDVALWLDGPGGWKDGFGDPTFSKWETLNKPVVRMVAFAAPRAGNAAFVEDFHRLGIEALRVVNARDIVPKVPGALTQALAWLQVPARSLFNPGSLDELELAQLDATSHLSKQNRQRCRDWCRRYDNFPRRDPDHPEGAPKLSWTTFGRWLEGPSWQHVWGFFHVGQVLKLDTAWVRAGPASGWTQDAKAPFLKPIGPTDLFGPHNLELHLYLISLLQPSGPPTGPNAGATATRNPLLLNKLADRLGDTRYPAVWWRNQETRVPTQAVDGHWVFDLQPGPQAVPNGAAVAAAAAAAAAGASAPAGNAAADDLVQQPDQQGLKGPGAEGKAGVKTSIRVKAE